METLLNPKLQEEARLDAYREGIIYFLEKTTYIFDRNKVKEKLKMIHSIQKLLDIQYAVARLKKSEVKDFLHHL